MKTTKRKSKASVDPAHVVDVTRCFAIVGKDREHVGRQCTRRPKAKGFFCASHINLDRAITGALRVNLSQLRDTARALKGE
jgi:hypothetical protein